MRSIQPPGAILLNAGIRGIILKSWSPGVPELEVIVSDILH